MGLANFFDRHPKTAKARHSVSGLSLLRTIFQQHPGRVGRSELSGAPCYITNIYIYIYIYIYTYIYIYIYLILMEFRPKKSVYQWIAIPTLVTICWHPCDSRLSDWRPPTQKISKAPAGTRTLLSGRTLQTHQIPCFHCHPQWTSTVWYRSSLASLE